MAKTNSITDGRRTSAEKEAAKLQKVTAAGRKTNDLLKSNGSVASGVAGTKVGTTPVNGGSV